jgi:hypothetical protein
MLLADTPTSTKVPVIGDVTTRSLLLSCGNGIWRDKEAAAGVSTYTARCAP